MLLLDTCTLLWWTLEPDQLSKKADLILKNTKIENCFLSSISLWEIGIKIKNKKLYLGMDFEDYVQRLIEESALNILPVELNHWLTSINLKWNNKDPVDRVIVATAASNKWKLLTADKKILNFYKLAQW